MSRIQKYSVKTFKDYDFVSVWWIGCCEWEMKSNNVVGVCVYVYVMMPLLWLQVNMQENEMSPVGQTGFCSQTASCHNPITFPFPPCPVVLLLCVLFKYCRTTYAWVCMHACINTQMHKRIEEKIQPVTILPPSMINSSRQGIYTTIYKCVSWV